MEAFENREDQRVFVQRVLESDPHGARAKLTNQASTGGSYADGKRSVSLGAKLAVVHQLKEGMKLRGGDEPGSPCGVLPDGAQFAGNALAGNRGPKCGVGFAALLRRSRVKRRFEERDREVRPADIQIGDRNRTI
jgi:hypothetical protein